MLVQNERETSDAGPFPVSQYASMQLIRGIAVALFILGVVNELWGLKCRSDDDDGSDDAEFRDAVRTCMNGDFRWNPQSDGADADFKYSQYGRGYRRSGESTSDSKNRSRQHNRRNPRDSDGGRSDSESNGRDYRVYGNPDSVRTTEEPLQRMEPCAVHCIFRQLGMLNTEDMPDKRTMMYVMTRNVRDQRVKWFIEDSLDECFELFEPEDQSGKCDFAKNVGLCLQEKGRRTCNDWDGTNSDQDNNNNRRQNGR